MQNESGRRFALVLDPADNVATLLFDAIDGDRVVLKGAPGAIVAREDILFGHKIALRPIAAGESILKYGQRIGYALKDLTPGQWVHLNSMASELDADFRRRIEK